MGKLIILTYKVFIELQLTSFLKQTLYIYSVFRLVVLKQWPASPVLRISLDNRDLHWNGTKILLYFYLKMGKGLGPS